MSGNGESVSSVTPDKQRIPCNNKRKKTSDNLIKGKEIIQVPYNPSEREKEDIIPDVENNNNHKYLHHLRIRETILVILMGRLVVPVIIQVKLVFV